METIAIPAMKILVGQLASPIWNELKTVWGLEDDIDKLQDLLSTINLVLGDAEKRSISEGVVRKWLTDLKDVALDADDVLDEIQTKAQQLRSKIYTPVATEVCLLFSYPNSIITQFKVAHKIQDIMKKFNEIADQISKLKLVENTTAVSHLDRETVSSIIEDDEIFGREDDKKKVIEWLIDAENEQKVAILPIVGLGGLGKTTLAQLVYNDEKLEGHFNIKKWVCVGENFNDREIVKAIIGTDKINLEEMQKKLQEEFLNKKYLLILDDVWNEDLLKWESLKALLRGSTHGNKIIVTTRSLEVARIMQTVSEPFKLGFISHDDCLNLFKHRAFQPRGKESETPNLVKIGDEIVQKCGRLPLAAKSVGSLMGTKLGEDQWLAVKNSEIWRVENSQEGIVPALQISFDHLSPQLKQCFTYCAMFPKDFEMGKLELIQLWIAGGFVESDEDKRLEDIGEEYFDILLWRSFFQEEERDNFGKIVSCKMHDLVHDLACSVSKDEISTLGSSWNSYRKCRHLSLSCGSTTVNLQTVANEARKLRSLFLFKDEDEIQTSIEKDVEFAIPNLTRLRALYAAHYIGSRNALSGIGKLKHLRFLDLSYSNVDSLPDSITNLYNLQTLLLKHCEYLEDLPKGMKKMVNLRHLDLEGCRKLTTMPSGLSRLTNLQTLPLFKVGNEEAGHLSLVELQPLKQIRGSLEISGLDNFEDPTDATKAELVTKKDIQALSLNFDPYIERKRRQFLRWSPCLSQFLRWSPCLSNDDDDDDVTVDVLENLQPHPNLKHLRIEYYDRRRLNVLENLQPHPNLKTLKIWRYGGSRLPNWLGSATALPNLVKLTLRGLSRCKSLPSLGQLPCLKELDMENMDGLKKIGAELLGSLSSTGGIIGGTTFPSLKSLTLNRMPLLEEWSIIIIIPKCDQGEVLFPSLETLKIESCRQLRIQPSLPSSILELTITECNEELLAAGGCLKGLFNLRKLTIQSMEASKTAGGWEGLQYLTNLEELSIVMCENLKCLPEEIMQHSFPFLRTLRLEFMTGIVSIEMEEQQQQQQEPPPLFMSLHHLQISSCDELRVLPGWLRGLTSLQSLTLEDSEKLEMLPDGLQQLTGLKQLIIKWCPILEERCKRDVGEDWHKISHIPHLHIYQSSSSPPGSFRR